MKPSEVVREAMKADGLSQKKLAERCGKGTQSFVGNALLNENGMRVDKFIELMNAMGYDVIVRRNKTEMVVTK